MRYYLRIEAEGDNQRTVYSKKQIAAIIFYWINKNVEDIEAFCNTITVVEIPDQGECKELDIREIVNIRKTFSIQLK